MKQPHSYRPNRLSGIPPVALVYCVRLLGVLVLLVPSHLDRLELLLVAGLWIA